MRKFASVAVALAAVAASLPAFARDITVGTLKITEPWTRVTPEGAKVAGGFMTITNTGTEADVLVGGTFPLAGVFQVHEMAMEGGAMKMRELAAGLEIKPGATVELKPGSYHVMFMELREPIKATAPVKGTLVFKKAGTVEVEYTVAPMGSKTSDGKGAAGHGAPMNEKK